MTVIFEWELLLEVLGLWIRFVLDRNTWYHITVSKQIFTIEDKNMRQNHWLQSIFQNMISYV